MKEYIASFADLLQRTVLTGPDRKELDQQAGVAKVCDGLAEVRKNAGTVYMIGNGGSSGIVSHSAVDLINTCKMKAVPITDSSLITCMANDFGYENVYKTPLANMCTAGDALIAVSSSGKSANITGAAEAVRDMGGLVITLSGFKPDNPLRSLGQINLWLDSTDYGMVEIGHALLLHHITDTLAARTA